MLSVSQALTSVIRPGLLVVEGVSVLERDEQLDEPLLGAERAVRAAPPPARAAVRAMYRSVGLDPTRRRPSSEALLRRVARGDPLPRINALVDICNWCSLELQLPYGVYDLNRVDGEVELRLGAPGEQYEGIRKDVVHVGGRLTLADRLGPFGNPSSDSARTMVTAATTRALVVIFAPRQVSGENLADALDVTVARIERFTGGRETARFIL